MEMKVIQIPAITPTIIPNDTISISTFKNYIIYVWEWGYDKPKFLECQKF